MRPKAHYEEGLDIWALEAWALRRKGGTSQQGLAELARPDAELQH